MGHDLCLHSFGPATGPFRRLLSTAGQPGGWRALHDAAHIRKIAGMDLPRMEQAFDFTQRCSQDGGLLVVRHGYLVFEKYYGRAHRNANPDMASTGKAVTSIACGIMLQEFRDKIPGGLDQKVFTEKYLPEAFPLDDPRKADITLGQLLCMTAGYHGEGGSPGIIHGSVVPLNPVAGQNIRDLDMSSIRTVLMDQCRGRLLLLIAGAPYCLHRAPACHRHGIAGLHQRAPGQADGLGTLGLLFAPG